MLVRVHIGDMEKTPAELLVRLKLFSKCIGSFDPGRGDREGEEEAGEKAQHDCLAPV